MKMSLSAGPFNILKRSKFTLKLVTVLCITHSNTNASKELERLTSIRDNKKRMLQTMKDSSGEEKP